MYPNQTYHGQAANTGTPRQNTGGDDYSIFDLSKPTHWPSRFMMNKDFKLENRENHIKSILILKCLYGRKTAVEKHSSDIYGKFTKRALSVVSIKA